MINAVFFTKYSREGASTRYRFLQYFPYFEDHGIRCELSPLTDADYLKHLYTLKRGTAGDCARALIRRLSAICGIRKYDIAVIEYELIPYFPPVFEALLNFLKIPYIVNYDDAVFYRYSRNKNALVRACFGGKIDRVIRGASLVIGGNKFLADYAGKAAARRVEMIPTVVDMNRYKDTSRGDNPVFTIGWIGSPSTSKYLNDIVPALAKVCAEGKARVVIIGAPDVKLPGVPVENRPWSETTEVRDLMDCNAGIMPLDDGLWEKGKCGLKAIQYMACGLPVVASPVGVNEEIVEGGVSGFLAVTNEDWVRALAALRDDRALRERMGRAGRKKAEEQYSLRVTAPAFARLITEVALRK
ncbi:MAG: glycosyltransferase family 4 protein [Candidatus Omnitrophica bacterium]|nr:glycosyltransferase family 4 protein [Candidatus Omnitrophota bacterium]